jgi:hypothetical protein
MPKYRGWKLTRKEKDAWEDLRDAILLDGRSSCLIRGVLNGKQRAFIAKVFEEGDTIKVCPAAVLLTEEEIAQVEGPQGERTEEV